MEHSRFAVTAIMAAFTLFSIGAARSLLTTGTWWLNGLEMLVIGGGAGTVSYLVGAAVSQLTGNAA
jgi:VIT1/CCC1 family predicted Fe2+/Mn2+ transporter